MLRGLLWLVLGLLVLAAALVASAPELLRAESSATMGLVGLVLAAGIPGAALIGLVAWRRRGTDPTPEEHADTRCVPVQRPRHHT